MSSLATLTGLTSIHHLSTEYVKVDVEALDDSDDPVDITGDSVWMAFTAVGVDPVADDWNVATWGTNTSTSPVTYIAKCLVGPNGTWVSSAGTFDVHVKVEDLPETPVLPAGSMTFE